MQLQGPDQLIPSPRGSPTFSSLSAPFELFWSPSRAVLISRLFNSPSTLLRDLRSLGPPPPRVLVSIDTPHSRRNSRWEFFFLFFPFFDIRASNSTLRSPTRGRNGINCVSGLLKVGKCRRESIGLVGVWFLLDSCSVLGMVY